MFSVKRMGPKTDPWGTLQVTVCVPDTSSGNVFCSVGEVRLKPVGGSVSESNGVM